MVEMTGDCIEDQSIVKSSEGWAGRKSDVRGQCTEEVPRSVWQVRRGNSKLSLRPQKLVRRSREAEEREAVCFFSLRFNYKNVLPLVE